MVAIYTNCCKKATARKLKFNQHWLESGGGRKNQLLKILQQNFFSPADPSGLDILSAAIVSVSVFPNTV